MARRGNSIIKDLDITDIITKHTNVTHVVTK